MSLSGAVCDPLDMRYCAHMTKHMTNLTRKCRRLQVLTLLAGLVGFMAVVGPACRAQGKIVSSEKAHELDYADRLDPSQLSR